MIINEDYFKELELTDDDIISDDSGQPTHIYKDYGDYSRHLTTQFKQCIIIHTSVFEDLFYNKTLWNTTIPNMLKRVELVLDVYNVDYEITFRDNTYQCVTMQSYPVGNYNVYSFYDTAEDFYDGARSAFVIIYCNFPKFTYKESYNFVDRL